MKTYETETLEKIEELFKKEGIVHHGAKLEDAEEFETWTRLGENMIIPFTREDDKTLAEDLAEAFYLEYESFDVDEHVGMLLEAKRNGAQDIPSSVSALVKDAEVYEIWLRNIAEGLNMIAREEKEHISRRMAISA